MTTIASPLKRNTNVDLLRAYAVNIETFENEIAKLQLKIENNPTSTNDEETAALEIIQRYRAETILEFLKFYSKNMKLSVKLRTKAEIWINSIRNK